MDGYVRSEFHNGITTIEFFHPQSNSLPSRILESLAQEIHGAGNDPDTRVIILRSAGEKSFCAGASFDELISIKTAEQGLQFFSGFAHVINAIRTAPKFVIGRIHGKCVGGGVGIAAAVDYAIATEAAEIKLSELAIGIGPFVVGPAVERKIGNSAFSQLSIDATLWRNADWARRKGLFAELHPHPDGMDEAISRLGSELAHSSPSAMAEMKRIFWRGTENWDKLLIERASISGRLVLSEFTKNAIEKFKKKRCKLPEMTQNFTADNFILFCDKLARKDKELKAIIAEHGHPPMWTRPGTFQTLVLTILEQQVSLASAFAAFKKLKERIGFVTPAKILALTDEDLRACYFSRQKTVYVRALARAIQTRQLNLKKLSGASDDIVKAELKKIKGIGDWTADVYLMHALQRTDLFPLGDIALVNSLKEVKKLPHHTTKEEMLAIAESWRPYRTIASMILWHAYIRKRNLKVQG